MTWLARLASHRRFLLFCMIGGINTGVHGVVLTLLVERFGMAAAAANGGAFLVANLFSFALNSRFVFCVPMGWRRYGRFFSGSLLSLALTVLISWGAERAGLHYLVGFGAVIVLVPPATYLIHRMWTFREGT